MIAPPVLLAGTVSGVIIGLSPTLLSAGPDGWQGKFQAVTLNMAEKIILKHTFIQDLR
jgi:hypothetical protein